MPGQYEEIKNWYNAIIDRADKAQSLANAGLTDNNEAKITAVNRVLTQALVDLWGGVELPKEILSAVSAMSEKMVREGVTSFKRKGDGEDLRKLKKIPDRLLRSVGFAGPESPSDFFKHQYRDAKAKGVVAISADVGAIDAGAEIGDRSRSASTVTDPGEALAGAGSALRGEPGAGDEIAVTPPDGSRGKSTSVVTDPGEAHVPDGSKLREIFAADSDAEEVDFTLSRTTRKAQSYPLPPPLPVEPQAKNPKILVNNKDSATLITEVGTERQPDWREKLAVLDERDKKAAARLGDIFAGKGKGPKFEFPDDLSLPGIVTTSHKKGR